MSKNLFLAVAAGAVLITGGAATSVQAADPAFCRDYAQAAVRQVHGAEAHRRCFEHIDNNPARWSPDFRAHFDWCSGVTRAQADAERDARRAILDRCVRMHDRW